MPSFDVVSKVDAQEVCNSVDQANREITTRFDFKDTGAKFNLSEESTITMTAPNDFQLTQMIDIIKNKLVKRQVDIRALEIKDPEVNLNEARQDLVVRQGLDKELAKKIVKFIKSQPTKTQPAIQGEQIRVTGKKRDELQTIIAALKDGDFDMPLQFENFRD